MVSGLQTRLSMQSRRSGDPSRYSVSSLHGDREGLMRGYDEEANGFALNDLTEDSDDDMRHANGTNGKHYGNVVELDNRKGGDR